MLEHYRRQKLEVIGTLSELCALARSVGALRLAGRLDQDVTQKLESDRFHLVVVGEFNHGKSTFVNALLGAAVLPVGVTPTTAAIHHLVYASEPSVSAVYAERSEALLFEDLKAFAAGGGRTDETLRYLEIGYPAELLRERLVLVDTPGVNDLSLTRAEITYDYIPRADAVLFVLDAGQPLKESERQFLERQLIGKSRDKIVFVVAKSDLWTAEEQREALAYIGGRLAALIPEPAIFPVSAQAALAGRNAESGIPELLAHLGRFLGEERGSIVLTNAVGEGVTASELLGRALQARRRAYEHSEQELALRIELLERELAGRSETVAQRRLMIQQEASAIKAWARRDLERMVDDVLRQLPAIIERSSADDLRQHLGVFLERTFRGWAEDETREIVTALERLAERTLALVNEDVRAAASRLGSAEQLKAPAIDVDTFAYDVGVFAVLSLGLGVVFANALLGGVLLAAAPALALWNRDRTTLQVRSRALELVPLVLQDAAAKIGPKIDSMVDDFADRLDNWVVTATEELHGDIIDVLRHVSRDRTEGHGSAGQEFESEQTRLRAISERLHVLRERVKRPHHPAPMTTNELPTGLSEEVPST